MPLSNPTRLFGSPYVVGGLINAPTYTTPSFTPSPNALVIVIVAAVNNLTPSPIETLQLISDTLGDVGGWSALPQRGSDAGADTHLAAWYAQAGPSPSAGTVTVGSVSGANISYYTVTAIEVTGHDQANPIVQTADNQSLAAAPSLTFGATPASDSLVLGFLNSRSEHAATSPGITPGSGFSELIDDRAGTSTAWLHVQYQNGGADTVTDWADVHNVRSLFVAVEIAAGASVHELGIDVPIETGAPVLDQTQVGQVHVLGDAALLEAQTPVLGHALLGQVNVFAPDGLESGAPTLDEGVVGQIHHIAPDLIETSDPETGNPAAGQVQHLGAEGLETGQPVLDGANLALTLDFVAEDLATGAPVLGNAAAIILNVVRGIATASPQLDRPSLELQTAIQGATLETGEPTLDVPVLSLLHIFDIFDVETDAPVVEAATLGQVHGLQGRPLLTGQPVLEGPFSDDETWIASPITTGNPELYAPVLAIITAIRARAIASGSPTLGQPSMLDVAATPPERTMVVREDNRVLVV